MMPTTMTTDANMTVVIVTLENFDHIRKIVHRLQEQTAKEQLEILIVTPSANHLALEADELEQFHSFHVIEVGGLRSSAQARLAAVQKSKGAIIAFAEDHCFPEPAWAESLIASHREPYAGVGAFLINGNPKTPVSWASFFLNFGIWANPQSTGIMSALPQHNSTYKRKDLLAFGDELETMLAAEILLQWRLCNAGRSLYLDPSARAHHVNPSRLSSYIREQFYGGRGFGASRAENWSAFRRLTYALASPLIPLVRLRRAWQELTKPFWREHLPAGTFPLIFLGIGLHTIGEMLGYAIGAGKAHEKFCDLEFRRHRHVVKQEMQFLREPAFERA